MGLHKGATQRNTIAIAKYSLDLAYAAGCDGPYLVGPFDSGDVREAAKVFRELAQYAESLGLQLALESSGWRPKPTPSNGPGNFWISPGFRIPALHSTATTSTRGGSNV